MATTIDTNPPLFKGDGNDDTEHWSEVAAWLLTHEEIDVTFIDREVLEELKEKKQ